MPHDTTGVTIVQDPSKRFGQVIRWVENPGDELEHNGASIFPVLYGEVLDINVARTFGRNASVDHVDSRLVVAEHDSGIFRRESQISHDSTHVAGVFGSGNGCQKFSFGGAGGSDGLGFASVGNGTATQKEGVAGGRAAVAEVVGVSSIKERSGFLRIICGEVRKVCGVLSTGEVRWRK